MVELGRESLPTSIRTNTRAKGFAGGWKGFGLATGELDALIRRTGDNIDSLWSGISNEPTPGLSVEVYSQITRELGDFSRSVLERAREVLVNGEPELAEAGRKVLFHSFLHSAIHGLKRAKGTSEQGLMSKEDSLSYVLCRVAELIEGYQNGTSTVRFGNVKATVNNEVFSYALRRKRNAVTAHKSNAADFDGLLAERNMVGDLHAAMACLDTRESRMLWRLQGDGLTLEEIGVEFGVTKERVRQIIGRILNKLRCPRLSPQLADYFTESVAGLRLRREIAVFEERLGKVKREAEGGANTLKLVRHLEGEFVLFAKEYCPNLRCQEGKILPRKDLNCDLRTFRSRLISAKRVLTDLDDQPGGTQVQGRTGLQYPERVLGRVNNPRQQDDLEVHRGHSGFSLEIGERIIDEGEIFF